MRFRDAVTAHTGWKLRVARYLSKPDGSLKGPVVRQDNQCDLGKWLYNEGRAFLRLREYQKLLEDHARLHQSAGDLVHLANLGERVGGFASLGDHTPFGMAAKDLAASLESLMERTGL